MKSQLNLITIIGIGIFAFLIIFEASSLIEYLLGQLIFIISPGVLATLWIPELIGIIIFIFILQWVIKKLKNQTIIFTMSTLTMTVVIFFALILLKFLYSMYGTGLLYESFPAEFEAFHKLRDDNRSLQSFMAFVPTLKYLIAAIFLFLNEDK